MLEELGDFYLKKDEPTRSALLAVRDLILHMDADISEAYKYRMPFFLFKGKMFAYLWLDKKSKEPYIGIVEGGKLEHPKLEKGNRARMKILRLDATQDLPFERILEILQEAMKHYP